MKKIIINTIPKIEIRTLWVFNKNIEKIDILKLNKNKFYKYQIFQGKILKIDFGLEIVFIDYGSKIYGILPFCKISKKFFFNKKRKLNLKIFKKNNYIKVQIIREEFFNKGALLTNIITITGNYLILLKSYNQHNKIIFSRNIKKKYINILKYKLKNLKFNSYFSLIVRRSAIYCSKRSLKEDYEIIYKKWKKIKNLKTKNDFFIFNKNYIFEKYLLYCLQIKKKRIIIDNKKLFLYLKKKLFFLDRLDIQKQLEFFCFKNLLNYFNLNCQFNSIFKKSLILPLGGKIFFNQTKHLFIIDVDSYKFSSIINFEYTAVFINLEAAYEISRQIRLRNLRGIIIIDFINMKYVMNNKFLEITIKKFFYMDESRIKFSKISKFGILEIVRSKL